MLLPIREVVVTMDISEKEQRRHEEDLQRLRGLRLLDDDFMSIVFGGNIETTQFLLNMILERTDVKVTEVTGQLQIKNDNGRSVRLDIHAVDSEGENFDVEIQREDRGAGSERARLNSSLLDTRMAEVGEKIPKLKPAYVIFITERDVLGGGFPMYHVDRTIREFEHAPFGDGSHIIYVNGAYKNDSEPIGQLMHDFRCTTADDMNFSVLADRVRFFKETEGGREQMCRVMEEMRDDAVHDRNVELAEKLIRRGKDSLEEIAELTELSLEEVEEIARKKSA